MRQRGAHRFAGGAGQHGLARLGQRVGGVAVVHQPEMRRQRRFQREAAQQRLAEGVDRADAHAARAGPAPGRTARGRAGAASSEVGWSQVAQGGVERGVAQRDPRAEGALQPDRHLRGGGLGEGEALDALRAGRRRRTASGAADGRSAAWSCRSRPRRRRTPTPPGRRRGVARRWRGRGRSRSWGWAGAGWERRQGRGTQMHADKKGCTQIAADHVQPSGRASAVGRV